MRNIAGIILAGGRSSRFGAPKDEALLQGVPLLDHVIARARPQVRALAISRAQSSKKEERRLPVVVDVLDDHGPMAGLHAALQWASSLSPRPTHVASFSCDAPAIPSDLVGRLHEAIEHADAPAAIPIHGGRVHPTFGLWSVDLLPTIEQRLGTGSRSLVGLAGDVGAVRVEIDDGEPGAFFNVNTQADLATLEAILERAAGPVPKPGIMEISVYAPRRPTIPPGGRIVRLNANENALGCSPAARAAVRQCTEESNLYPDPRATALREVVAAKFGLEPERTIFGAGSDELFAFACHTYLAPGDNAVQPQYGFAAWSIVTRAAGGDIRSAPETEYHVDVDALFAAVDERTRIVFVANPANPTGTTIPFTEIERLHAGLRSNILLVIDGAYAEFAGDYGREYALARSAGNVLVTRTFSKLHGLAALRIGWGYAAPAIIEAMERVRLPFNTTRPAQAAAAGALADDDFAALSIAYVEKERMALERFFREFDLEPLPSRANFVTVRFPKERIAAAAVEEELARRGVLVHCLAYYGLPDFLRVSVGSSDDLGVFKAALAEFMNGR